MTIDQSLQRSFLATQRTQDTQNPIVVIVDDDAAVREALAELILSAGFQPLCFGSTRELLDADILDSPGCLVLDVRMPGGSGLDLQQQLAMNGYAKPVVFLTGHGDIPMTVQATIARRWGRMRTRAGSIPGLASGSNR